MITRFFILSRVQFNYQDRSAAYNKTNL